MKFSENLNQISYSYNMLHIFICRTSCYDSLINLNDDLSYANFSITGEENNISIEEKSINVLKQIDFNVMDFSIKNTNNTEGGGFRYSGTEIFMNVKNASFINCSSNLGGSIYFSGIYPLYINNSSFRNSSSTSHGGTGYISTVSNTTILNSLFELSNGTEGGSLWISSPNILTRNCSFMSSKSSSDGGSIYISTSQNTLISESTFMNSKGNKGGTAFIKTTATISIINNLFKDSNGNSGGTLNLDTQNASIIGCRFFNSCSSSGGGSTYISSSSNTKLENSIFLNSYSLSGGGAAYVTSSKNTSLLNCSFINCSSLSNGGTAYISSSINTSINNCSFVNSSGLSGGTLIVYSPYVEFSNSSFIDVYSKSQGGSSYIYSKYCKFCQIWIENSTSENLGGATYIYSTNDGGLFHFSDSFFGDCKTSQDGGAIYIVFSLNDIIEVYSCTFFSCICQREGGALCFVNNNRGSFVVDLKRVCIFNCKTTSSTTSHRGSSILIESHTQYNLISLSLITISSCGSLDKGTGTLYINLGQQKGDGMNISYCSSFLGSGSFFSPNFAANYDFNNLINCSSSSTYCIFNKILSSSYSFEFTKSNIINSGASSYVFNVDCGYHYKWSFRYSILYGNKGTLFYVNQGTNQYVQYCYIVHSGTYSNANFQYTLCVTTQSTSVLTPTYALSHYSTYLCAIPNEQGSLEVPCQTIPEELIPPECPPIPSTCNVPTEAAAQFIGLISTVIHIISSSYMILL